MVMADMVVDIFNAESTLLRVHKMSEMTLDQDIETYDAILKSYLYETNFRMYKSAIDAIGLFVSEELIPMYMKGIKMLTKYPVQNIKNLKRAIASVQIKADEYAL
ncbi:MAG: acyl-CoA dehydrogenase, partial [Saprospiraceae bacterium]|nr:acyl-CoA dehydrogenase [Saprospiraceae bacterium]